MATDESIVEIMNLLQAGDEQAASRLWDQYFPHLLRIARAKLAGQKRRIADEEDVVLSVLNSFFRRVQAARFPDLQDRDCLWRLLSEMTRRKAIDLIRFNDRQKRAVAGESALGSGPGDSSSPPIENVAGPENGPDIAMAAAENCGELLGSLDPDLQRLAILKLDGHSNQEIAHAVQRSVATVERRLRLVRDIWSDVIGK